MRCWRRRLYRFCMRLAGRTPDADDLLQETFLRLHRAYEQLRTAAGAAGWKEPICRKPWDTLPVAVKEYP